MKRTLKGKLQISTTHLKNVIAESLIQRGAKVFLKLHLNFYSQAIYRDFLKDIKYVKDQKFSKNCEIAGEYEFKINLSPLCLIIGICIGRISSRLVYTLSFQGKLCDNFCTFM